MLLCRNLTAPLIVALAVLMAGCDMPVRVGVQEARAAGVNVGGMPHPVQHVATATPAVAAQAASTSSAVSPRSPQPKGGLLFLPPVPQPHDPDDLVGVVLQPEGQAAEARSISFGQVFIPGQLPRGSGIVARVGGHDVPTQFDAKTKNPDGSVRFGIVTMTAAAPADVMLARAPVPATPPLDLANVVGHDDVAVDLVLHGDGGDTPRHFDVGPLLARALASGTASYWLRGPLVTEARVDVPVASSFHLTFDVRGYADGTIRSDLQFNNDIAMQPTGGKVSYDVTIRQNGKPIFAQGNIVQFQYQTWHREIWSNGEPAVNVVHDIAAMERAGAVHTYDLTTGVNARLVENLRQRLGGPGFGVLGNADLVKYMGATGGRADIGPMTQANTVWLLTQNADAARYALAQADAAGSVPWHFFDRDNESYVTVIKYPKLWTDPRGGNGPDTTGLTQKVDDKGSGWFVELSHQPDVTYLPYLMTGSRYRLDQLSAQVTNTIIGVWSGPREAGRGIVANRFIQVRGAAWNLREIVEGAYAQPDDSPLKPYLEHILANNITYLHDAIATAHEGEATGYLFPPPPGAKFVGLGPWQEDFLVCSLVLAARQGIAGAHDVLVWLSQFMAGRFLAADKGFPPWAGGSYYLIVTDGDGKVAQTWAEILRLTQEKAIQGTVADNGTRWAPMTYPLALATDRGALGALITVTNSDEAKQALAWLEANAPQIGPQRQQQDPTWNIVPLRTSP